MHANRTKFRVADREVGYGKWWMPNDEWRMTNGGRSMTDERCAVKSGGCDEEQSGGDRESPDPTARAFRALMAAGTHLCSMPGHGQTANPCPAHRVGL